MVKNKKDANITRFVCNNCAKNLKDALDQKDERLTRKADGFVRLFEMKDKIEDNKELNIDMDAGDQLEILLRQEGEDIKDKVKISYYKKIKKISKDKIEDFLDI